MPFSHGRVTWNFAYRSFSWFLSINVVRCCVRFKFFILLSPQILNVNVLIKQLTNTIYLPIIYTVPPHFLRKLPPPEHSPHTHPSSSLNIACKYLLYPASVVYIKELVTENCKTQFRRICAFVKHCLDVYLLKWKKLIFLTLSF